ncbi:MAG: preprotein translocase subunit YajC [Veillonellaceae bacterium]|nr:preprotein translocase subunit YajC [Veillonellaceae bacterium]MDD6924170.1 preprotein translocase subunit YajC [Veillonellaceae bacterium]
MDMQSLGVWGPILLMVVIFYFLLYRPQKNAQKKRQSLLDSIEVGDRIMTVGGIYGEITKVEDDTVMLKISDDVQLKLSRAAVHINITKQEAAQTDDKKD